MPLVLAFTQLVYTLKHVTCFVYEKDSPVAAHDET